MPIDIASEIALHFHLKPDHVRGCCRLFDEGNTPTFIAHYRVEATGGLSEELLQDIQEYREELQNIETRRQTALRNIREQGRLTEELEAKLNAAATQQVLDDLYLPYRPARHTAATKAIDRGLQPLATAILEDKVEGDIEDAAANFVHHDRDVHTVEDALAGAGHILAEEFSCHTLLRQKVRDLLWSQGTLRCARLALLDDQVKEFRDYFRFSESVHDLPPHRILAVNRGEQKKALKVIIDVPQETLLSQARALVIPEGHRRAAFLTECLKDCLNRLVLPAVMREVRRTLSRQAEKHAIDVFASNIHGILMTPPVAGKRVLAIDPGFRTGCKTAAIDADGRLLGETIVYPHEPQSRWDDAKAKLLAAVRKYAIDVVAIGNGTGCHETEELVSEIIAENDLDIEYTLVSEAGASAYAASALAAEEFPQLDPSVRATVSVGRRLQNPMSEFVKVDPRVIGVGLYQHDIDQQRLRDHLMAVTRRSVNDVGVDVNRANVALMEHVAGFDAPLARAVIAHRQEHGPFATREGLKSVPGIDDRVFRQAAGFLMIYGGENPLDRTRVHPESYPVAQGVLDHFGYSPSDLSGDGLPGFREKLEGQSLETLSEELRIGIPTLSRILLHLEHPGYDPRDENPRPIFKKQRTRIEDLSSGMWLKGSVRNVVDFGAFVDVGVSEDGLVHVSQFSRKYIKNPVDFVHVGQTVDVRIISIDKDRHRIALSMIPDDTPPVAPTVMPPELPPDVVTQPAPPAPPLQ
jgi:protein Tex